MAYRSTSEVKGEDDENRSGMDVGVNFYVAVVGDNNCCHSAD